MKLLGSRYESVVDRWGPQLKILLDEFLDISCRRGFFLNVKINLSTSRLLEFQDRAVGQFSSAGDRRRPLHLRVLPQVRAAGRELQGEGEPHPLAQRGLRREEGEEL